MSSPPVSQTATKATSASCSAKHSEKQQMGVSSSAVFSERYDMKKVILLPIILGLTLTLTGCKSNDAESNFQESPLPMTTSKTTSTVRTESATSSIPETASKEDETIATQSEPIVTDALDTPTNAVEPEIETTVSVPVSNAKFDKITESGAVPPQLETVPEDAEIEEDTGDFGELFS